MRVVSPNPLSKLPLMVLPFPSLFIGFVGGVAEKKGSLKHHHEGPYII
jgi:hypothetical protein